MANPSNAITAQSTDIKGVIEKSVSVEFVASTKKLIRTTGSWITDGYLVGMDITTTDAANLSVGKATLVTALEMTVDGTVVNAVAGNETVTGKATIGEIKSFNGPGGQASDIDVTTLQSTAKEFRRGLQDEGEISFDVNLDPSDVGQIFCRTARAENVAPFGKRSFELVLPDATTTTLEFEAFVKGFSISGGVDAAVTASISLRITGPVVWS